MNKDVETGETSESNIEIIETAVKNIKELERLGVSKTHPLYREQIEKLVGGTAEYDTHLFEEDLENVAKVIPPMDQMVEDDEVTKYQEDQLRKLQRQANQEPEEVEEDSEEEEVEEDSEEEEVEEEGEKEVFETHEVEEYVNIIVNKLGIENNEYKRAFELELSKAVKHVMQGRGYMEFAVDINGKYENGTVNRYSGGFTIIIGDVRYTATPYHNNLQVKNMKDIEDEEPKESNDNEIKGKFISGVVEYVNDIVSTYDNIEQDEATIKLMRSIIAQEVPNGDNIYKLNPRDVVLIWALTYPLN